MKEFEVGQKVYHYEDMDFYPSHSDSKEPIRYRIRYSEIVEKQKMTLSDDMSEYRYIVDNNVNGHNYRYWLWGDQIFSNIQYCKNSIVREINEEIEEREKEKEKILKIVVTE